MCKTCAVCPDNGTFYVTKSYKTNGTAVAAGTCEPCVAASSDMINATQGGGDPCYNPVQNGTATGCGACPGLDSINSCLSPAC